MIKLASLKGENPTEHPKKQKSSTPVCGNVSFSIKPLEGSVAEFKKRPQVYVGGK